MKYTVLRIDEDIDFGCEEHAADAPVMAVVTLRDENGLEIVLRQPDQMLYDRDINEGDEVILDRNQELQKNLDTLMEARTGDSIDREAIEKSYETGLPAYLQNDLDAYKEGLKQKSSLLDCLWGELYGSINTAEISEGSITPEHAAYLRKKYL